MKISIAELSTLSQRLQNALDSNYNVLDMPTILDVIQVLEGTQITKEQLETTRLAKHINQLRRNKSLNELLARRLKNLIKKWREMVIPTGGQQLQSQQTHSTANVSCISPPVQAVTSSSGIVKPLSGMNLTNGSRPQYSRAPNTGISTAPMGYRPATTTAMPTQSPMQRKTTKPTLPPATLSGSVVRPQIIPLAKPYQRNNGGGTVSTTTRPGPISFTNLISQAEANQKHITTSGSSSTTGSAKRTAHYDDRSLSPMHLPLPKIPRIMQPSDRLDRSSSPFDLFGGGPISQQPPPQLFQDKDDHVTTTVRSHDALLLDDSNSRKNFNGSAATRPFRITSSSMDVASDSNSFPAIDKSSSSFALHPIGGPDGTTTTSTAIASQSLMSAKHKKHKKEKKKSRTDRKLTDPYGKTDIRTDIPAKGDFRCLRMDDSSKTGVSPQYDAPNSLSSDSNTLFNSTTSNLTASGPVITTETTNHQAQLQQSHWKPITAMSSNRTHSSELTFSGKFSKSDDTDTIINIDSSSSDYDTHFRPVSVPATFIPKIPTKKRTHDLIASASTPSFSPVIVHESRSCSPVPLASMENSLDVLPIDRAYRSAVTKQPSMVTGSLSEDTITGGESSSLPPAGDITVGGTVAALAPAEPKKRGRKKGSNGADRRLADAANSTSASGGNAFESSLSGLKNKIDLMRTGGAKKVKSTQELIAGLQNRGGKIEDVDSGGQFLQRDRTSSPDSDSQTDSTDVIRSTTATVSTPESVFNDYESSNAAGKKYVSAAARFIAGATIPPARSIQEELTELAAQLHPIDMVAVAQAIEAGSQDIAPCTCRLIEVEDIPVVEATTATTTSDESNKPALHETIEPVTVKPKAPDPIQSSPPVVPPPRTPPQVLPPATEPLRIVVAPKKPVKSIFDLDYDEDEDPIHKFSVVVQAAPALPQPPPPQQQPDIKPIENANKKTVIDQPVELVAVEALPPPSTEPTGPQMPRFEIIEDPNCLAAEFYHTQRGDVCEEHLEILHNTYVPNVNGNWDNGSAALDIEPDNDADGNEIEPDLYERIVPTYNYMCIDRIPKNLRHITFNPEQRDYKRRASTPAPPPSPPPPPPQPPEVIEVPTEEDNLRLNDGLDQIKTEDETIPANGNVPLSVIDPYVLNDGVAIDYDAVYDNDDDDDDEYGNVVNQPDIGDPALDDTDLDEYDVPRTAYEPMSMDFDIPAVDLFPSAPTQPSLWLAPSLPSEPLSFEPLQASPPPSPPIPPSRRSSSKVKYKIRKCSTDLVRDDNTIPQTTAENSCATGGSSTKIIIKLSRQLTNCSEEDEEDDEDDEEYEDDEDEDDYEDDEDEIDEEDECDEDEEDVELIAVPDNESNIIAAERNDLENCTKTIVSPHCDDDDVANNNDEQIGEAKPFIDTIDTTIAEHEEIVVTTTSADDHRTESDAIEALPAEAAVIEITEPPKYEAQQHTEHVAYERLTNTNYGQLPSFDNLTDDNVSGRNTDGARFREWHEVVRVRSYNDELLTILPYVVID